MKSKVFKYDYILLIFQIIMDEYPNESIAMTSILLLGYMNGFRSERIRVLKQDKDSIEKGQKLHDLIAFKESLEVFEKVEKKIKELVLEKTPKKKKISRVKLFMSDGNIFLGKIAKETKKYMLLRTSIGEVRIDKSKIAKREDL